MMTTNEKPKYFSVTPADVRYDDRLQLGARFLYGEISVLSNQNGYCWAGDSYFSKLYNVDNRTIQRWLMVLEECGYITRTVKYKEGSKEIEKRFIRLREDLMPDNYPEKPKKRVKNETTYRHECQGGTDINVVDNNTRYNNKERAKCTSASSKKADEEELESNFEKLWKLYPNKKGKVPALRAYKRVMKHGGTTNRDIQNGIVAYARLNAGTDKKYIMHGGTFFNQEAWADYAEDFEQQQQQQVQQQQSQTPMSTFTLKDVAVELYRECDEDYEKIAEEIKEQEIPLSIDDAKRYIEEFKEERDKQ